MPKVICTLENASEEISGVKFTKTEDGMLSEDISQEQAEFFAGIKGYDIIASTSAPAAAKSAKAPKVKPPVVEPDTATEPETEDAPEPAPAADPEAGPVF